MKQGSEAEAARRRLRRWQAAEARAINIRPAIKTE
jgi:hypothetical protein